MNKATGEELLDINGKKITSEVTFIAESKDGSIEVEFKFCISELDTETAVVVFEDLYNGNILLCSHADITDVDQTVEIVPPKTGDSSNTHIYLFALIASLLALIGASFGAIRSRK